MMRRFLIGATLLAISGCQTEAPRYTGQCVDRAFDAGFCDRPTNWRLFGPRTGPFIGISSGY